MANEIFIDYSPAASDAFREAFTPLYRSFIISSRVSNKTKSAGFILGTALSALHSGLTSLDNKEVDTITSLLSSIISSASVLIWGISGLVASIKKKDVGTQIARYPHFFNSVPEYDTGLEDKIASVAPMKASGDKNEAIHLTLNVSDSAAQASKKKAGALLEYYLNPKL